MLVLCILPLQTRILSCPAHSMLRAGVRGRARTAMRLPNRAVYLVPMQLLTILSICSRSWVSMGNASSSTMLTASSSACMKPRTMTVGCKLRSRKGSAMCSISPAAGGHLHFSRHCRHQFCHQFCQDKGSKCDWHYHLPRMMTEVVPSPTSSSCVRLSSMMDCCHSYLSVHRIMFSA